ncbi:MAG: hypothetical protein R3F13_12775 [Prosthecobacter sp.]
MAKESWQCVAIARLSLRSSSSSPAWPAGNVCAIRHVFPSSLKLRLLFRPPPPETVKAADYDLLITNARIADGTGHRWWMVASR